MFYEIHMFTSKFVVFAKNGRLCIAEIDLMTINKWVPERTGKKEEKSEKEGARMMRTNEEDKSSKFHVKCGNEPLMKAQYSRTVCVNIHWAVKFLVLEINDSLV